MIVGFSAGAIAKICGWHICRSLCIWLDILCKKGFLCWFINTCIFHMVPVWHTFLDWQKIIIFNLQICQPHILAMAPAENPTIIKINLVKNLPLYFDRGFKPTTLMVIGTECTDICFDTPFLTGKKLLYLVNFQTYITSFLIYWPNL
jgi:hypothetical protein